MLINLSGARGGRLMLISHGKDSHTMRILVTGGFVAEQDRNCGLTFSMELCDVIRRAARGGWETSHIAVGLR